MGSSFFNENIGPLLKHGIRYTLMAHIHPFALLLEYANCGIGSRYLGLIDVYSFLNIGPRSKIKAARNLIDLDLKTATAKVA